ncbi:MAG: RIP metalloprotease RseP [Pseudomonadota bacterium]
MLSQPPAWFMLLAFLAAIGPLIIFHELGHYWVARWFGVGAEAFSIGFGKEIAGWTDKRGTRWRIGALPLGGYVKFVGDADATSAPVPSEAVPAHQRGRAFNLRPPWQRFLIVLAGPMTNFLIAILIFVAFFAAFGKPQTPSLVQQVVVGSAAERAGVRPGDRIVEIAGRSTPSFEELQNVVTLRPGETVDIAVVRDGRTQLLSATLGTIDQANRFGQRFKLGQLGVGGGKYVLVDLPVHRLVPEAISTTYRTTVSMVDGLWQIISGRRSIKDLGGPLRMAQIAGQVATLGVYEFIQLIAFFSINLGFINLLPIPMLDGGHLVLYGIETVRRRPASEQIVEWAFRGGLAFLLALLLVATFNDLSFFGLFDGVGRLIG